MNTNELLVRMDKLLQETMAEARKYTPDVTRAAVQIPALKEQFPQLKVEDALELTKHAIDTLPHWYFLSYQPGGKYGSMGIWFTDDYGWSRIGTNPSY